MIEFLHRLGCSDITVCDKNEDLKFPHFVKKRLGDEYLVGLTDFDILFRSPGIPRDLASILDAEEAPGGKKFMTFLSKPMLGAGRKN